ncbi:hypothetical protein HanRHA438_Chr15g0724011 [Helianthus annuus]|nr:hypothetical protein HanRHA438_Chr15g0724011 [Helianthus annuus]
MISMPLMKAYELGEGVKVTFRICVSFTRMSNSLMTTASVVWVFLGKERARKALKLVKREKPLDDTSKKDCSVLRPE